MGEHITVDLSTAGIDWTTFDALSGTSWTPNGALILPYMDDIAPDLSTTTLTSIKNWIQSGGNFISLGGSVNAGFLNSLFGWSLTAVNCQGRGGIQTMNKSQCSWFCNEENETTLQDIVYCIEESSLPTDASAVYSKVNYGSGVTVFTMEYGDGFFTYLGFIWHDTERTQWPTLLKTAVLQTPVASSNAQVDCACDLHGLRILLTLWICVFMRT